MDITKILDLLKERQLRSVCVEAAHIYMNEDPNETHDFTAKIGADIANAIEKHGGVVSRHLFIDNFNPGPESFKLDVNKYISRLNGNNFSPQVVTFETDLELPAKNILYALNGKIDRFGEDVFLKEKGVKLISGGRPTCNLLDASLYVAKLSMFQLAITVLPLSWKNQQNKVRRILNELGYVRLPIINVFVNCENQEISLVF